MRCYSCCWNCGERRHRSPPSGMKSGSCHSSFTPIHLVSFLSVRCSCRHSASQALANTRNLRFSLIYNHSQSKTSKGKPSKLQIHQNRHAHQFTTTTKIITLANSSTHQTRPFANNHQVCQTHHVVTIATLSPAIPIPRTHTRSCANWLFLTNPKRFTTNSQTKPEKTRSKNEQK